MKTVIPWYTEIEVGGEENSQEENLLKFNDICSKFVTQKIEKSRQNVGYSLSYWIQKQNSSILYAQNLKFKQPFSRAECFISSKVNIF